MSSRLFADGFHGWTYALTLITGCAVFEEPLVVQRVDASVTSDAETVLPHAVDAAAPMGDAAETQPEDALVADAMPLDAAVVDATPDAAVDAGPAIPARPMLSACGFALPVSTGTISAPRLDEISGIAVSRRNPQILWAIEDSGNGASVHALTPQGVLVATFTVQGGGVDYEDIAMGPGPLEGVSYLYIADIGDNNATRSSIVVYRAAEPEVSWQQAFATSALPGVDPIPIVYPDGAHNAEALMVDPTTQDLYLISKDGYSQPNTLYRLRAPHTPASPRSLEKLLPLYAGDGIDIAVTAADMSADGRHIVIRSLRSINHWTRQPGASVLDTLRDTQPCAGELSSAEAKGESISVADNGYYTISEGASESLHFVSFEHLP